MLFENGINAILRFFVAIKVLLSFQPANHALFNFCLTLIFGSAWAVTRLFASKKNGDYGAPESYLSKFEKPQSISGDATDTSTQQDNTSSNSQEVDEYL